MDKNQMSSKPKITEAVRGKFLVTRAMRLKCTLSLCFCELSRSLRAFCLPYIGALFLTLTPNFSAAAEPLKTDAKASLLGKEVGMVSFSLGEAYIVSGGQRQEVSRGLQVYVGDLIHTEPSGHVHLRFVDDALVSVRPNSSLDITRYDFDEDFPENSTVKFELTEGVARSISGKAAKYARQRFRLNTPVAAIGVRGTDFVVSANSRTTRAQVNEGVIVMAPFSDQCSSETFGPCALNAVELASNSFEVIELNEAAALPAVQARESSGQLSDLRDRFQLSKGAQGGSDEKSEQRDVTSVYLESVATGRVKRADSSAQADRLSVADLPDYTPEEQLLASETADMQLVWGRFGSAGASKELVSLERVDAADGRNVTIAASDYLLYRIEPNGARVDKGLGVVGFTLESAQAFHNSPLGEYSMRVADGALEVNFSENQFSTRLDLDSDRTGPIFFTGSGRVAPGGYLIGMDSSDSLVGAVSTDGTEAGYFFEQLLESGSVSGLTLWGSQ
jgi:hypothetical protein